MVVELGCVRNSLGAEAFVADEVPFHLGPRVLETKASNTFLGHKKNTTKGFKHTFRPTKM